MMAEQAEASAARLVDSLEVRWMVPGRAGIAMREWFARFPAETEAREDTYLLQPRLPGLSVKLRGGSVLDVKSFLGTRGFLDLPHRCRGRVEFWRKWSFPCQPPGLGSDPPAGWGVVRKTRRRSWFPLDAGQDPVSAVLRAVQTGCLVELTQARADAGSWWSVGFEATGSAGLLRAALEHAADLVFAQALPPGIELSLDKSLSYAQWLSRQPVDTAGLIHGMHMVSGQHEGSGRQGAVLAPHPQRHLQNRR